MIRESNERIAREKQLNGEDCENNSMSSQCPKSPPKESTKLSLTDEQRERMLKNRQLAEERRRKKMEEQSQIMKSSQLVVDNDDDSAMLSQ